MQIKKLFILLFLTVLLLPIQDVKAVDNNNVQTKSLHEQYNNIDFVIEGYDININVNENNTFDITEKMNVYFNKSSHGIYRMIPLKNSINRMDGTKTTNRAKVTDLYVDNEYITSIEDNSLSVRIGSPDRTITGTQQYTIKYNYNIGKDPLKDTDEFYYNIIGSGWGTMIDNITFKITMPKEFDSSKLGFSSGKPGSTDSSKVIYHTDGKIITGSYKGILYDGEALTVRCELPEEYFVNEGFGVSIFTYLMFIIPIVGLIISFAFWIKYGRDEEVIETVEFYPPGNFNSLETGFLYKGKADGTDVMSLLVYLANKGYIKISETNEKSLFSKVNGFEITKLKEYDGDDINEKMFLTGLFSKKHTIDSKRVREILKTAKENGEKMSYIEAVEQDELLSDDNSVTSVTLEDLYDSFYNTVNRILLNVNVKDNKFKIFEKGTTFKYVVVIIALIISFIMIVAVPTAEYLGFGSLGSTLLVLAFYIPFFAVGFSSGLPIKFRILWLGFTIIHFSLMIKSIPFWDAISSDSIYTIGVIIGTVCLIGMIVFFKLMPKRTKYGNEILGKLKGFRNYLKTAEKDKLEAMVKKDPSYFYSILPYTYVLGVSSEWIKKFESIAMKAPSWYEGTNAFDVSSFGSFMNSTMSSASSAASSDSSSSGGGSSGGGSGGGGGGSW